MVERAAGGRRADGRRAAELRPIRLVPGFLPPAEGSVLIEMGATRVVCTATVSYPVQLRAAELSCAWTGAADGTAIMAVASRPTIISLCTSLRIEPPKARENDAGSPILSHGAGPQGRVLAQQRGADTL